MPGVALFACSAADLWVECPSPIPFEDEFTIADRPMLRQLAHLDEDYTNALFVMVDTRAARIYEVVLGGLADGDGFCPCTSLDVTMRAVGRRLGPGALPAPGEGAHGPPPQGGRSVC